MGENYHEEILRGSGDTGEVKAGEERREEVGFVRRRAGPRGFEAKRFELGEAREKLERGGGEDEPSDTEICERGERKKMEKIKRGEIVSAAVQLLKVEEGGEERNEIVISERELLAKSNVQRAKRGELRKKREREDIEEGAGNGKSLQDAKRGERAERSEIKLSGVSFDNPKRGERRERSERRSRSEPCVREVYSLKRGEGGEKTYAVWSFKK